MEYTPTIGLEIHTQLNTKTKLFCSDKNDPDEQEPNTNICGVCMGHPGTLPVLNEEAVKKIVQAGMALACTINQFSKFDRKNYFYPDLPKGYQISQYDMPFCVSGKLRLSSDKEIRIRRIHLEEDTGRLVHESANSKRYSYIDFNRAGVPLMELVTEPDFRSSDEVLEFAKEIQLLWRYLGISEADMEKGEMRVEANISLDMGTKVEVKNLNSFKAVKEGIAFEIARQKEMVRKGEKIIQETRGWDPIKRKTFSQREKETEKDYRYFPEPDLPPVIIDDEKLKAYASLVRELPWERKTRFAKEYSLPLADVDILVRQKELGEYFEEVASELRRWERDVERKDVIEEHLPRLIKMAADYLINKTRSFRNITPENFAELIVLAHKGMLSSSAAQRVLLEMEETGDDPHAIIEVKGLSQVSEEDALISVVENVLKDNPKPVQDYKKGKEGALTFLLGKAMGESKGKANPRVLRELLKKRL